MAATAPGRNSTLEAIGDVAARARRLDGRGLGAVLLGPQVERGAHRRPRLLGARGPGDRRDDGRVRRRPRRPAPGPPLWPTRACGCCCSLTPTRPSPARPCPTACSRWDWSSSASGSAPTPPRPSPTSGSRGGDQGHLRRQPGHGGHHRRQGGGARRRQSRGRAVAPRGRGAGRPHGDHHRLRPGATPTRSAPWSRPCRAGGTRWP